MSQLIGICGPSGTGKSTALRTLNPKETFIINPTGKALPFKGSKGLYPNVADVKVTQGGRYLITEDPQEIIKYMKNISEKVPEIKTIILDDSQYIMAFEFMRKINDKGYGKFTEIGKNFFDIIDAAKNLRDDLKVFILTHSEENIVGTTKEVKMKTVGKMLDTYITLEGLFTIFLYTDVQFKKTGSEYTFVTNKTKDYPAKSPMDMFELNIPNDLKLVSEKIDEYYA